MAAESSTAERHVISLMRWSPEILSQERVASSRVRQPSVLEEAVQVNILTKLMISSVSDTSHRGWNAEHAGEVAAGVTSRTAVQRKKLVPRMRMAPEVPCVQTRGWAITL